MHVAITGATGFIGGHLASRLESEGIAYSVLTRSVERARQKLPHARAIVHWDPPSTAPEALPLEGLDAVVHLAGVPVAQRWTRAARTAISESRIRSTETLTATLVALGSPPPVLVSNSAIGFYGPRDDTPLDENAPGGTDFLAGVCRHWEEAATPASEHGIRVVHPRIGIVLGPNGGALSMMLTPFRIGLGGPIGSGKQWMSWVHVDDVVGLMLHAIRDRSIGGPLNVTSPEPVRNREFARALGAALHRPAFLPTPIFGLRALYGDFAHILATGQRVIPAKARATGYTFRYPDLGDALRNILK